VPKVQTQGEENLNPIALGSKLLAGVHLSKQGSNTHPKKSKSRFTSQGRQVSESPELTRIVSQFIDANRVSIIPLKVKLKNLQW
jgi:hypothetical protein